MVLEAKGAYWGVILDRYGIRWMVNHTPGILNNRQRQGWRESGRRDSCPGQSTPNICGRRRAGMAPPPRSIRPSAAPRLGAGDTAGD